MCYADPGRDPDPKSSSADADAVTESVSVQFIEAPRVRSAADAAILEFLIQILIVIAVVVVDIVRAIGIVVVRSDRRGAFLHGIHALEVDPRGTESGNGQRTSALDLGAVSFSELLHLVTALHGGFGRRGVRAASGDGLGDFLPVGSLEVAAAEGVPFVAVGVNEGDGLVVRPARRRKTARGRRRRRRDGKRDGGWRSRRRSGVNRRRRRSHGRGHEN